MKPVLLVFFSISVVCTYAQSVILHGFEKNSAHILEWVVTECSYISHFEVERSTDESRFEVVYTMEIKSYDCNGNYSYTFTDIPKAYKYAYRIRAYLNTALPIVSGTTVFFYQPEHIEINHFILNNSTIQFSVISRQKNAITLNITDISGKTLYNHVFEVQAGKQDIQLPVSISGTGIYFVRITDNRNHFLYQNRYLLKNN